MSDFTAQPASRTGCFEISGASRFPQRLSRSMIQVQCPLGVKTRLSICKSRCTIPAECKAMRPVMSWKIQDLYYVRV
jgi:hypothetical protein